MSVLESERLILRPPRPSDVAAMTVWLGDYDVARMLSRVPYPYSEGDAESFVALALPHRFVVQRKQDGLFMGMIGLHTEDDFEFGYWLGKPFWGRGYATEAARRLVNFAFAELKKIAAVPMIIGRQVVVADEKAHFPQPQEIEP